MAGSGLAEALQLKVTGLPAIAVRFFGLVASIGASITWYKIKVYLRAYQVMVS